MPSTVWKTPIEKEERELFCGTIWGMVGWRIPRSTNVVRRLATTKERTILLMIILLLWRYDRHGRVDDQSFLCDAVQERYATHGLHLQPKNFKHATIDADQRATPYHVLVHNGYQGFMAETREGMSLSFIPCWPHVEWLALLGKMANATRFFPSLLWFPKSMSVPPPSLWRTLSPFLEPTNAASLQGSNSLLWTAIPESFLGFRYFSFLKRCQPYLM